MLLGTDLFPKMAELDRDPFNKIQMLLGADLFSTMAEADKTNTSAIIKILLVPDSFTSDVDPDPHGSVLW